MTMPNINIEVPEDLHKQLKLKALLEDKALKDYFTEILEKHT